MVTWHEYPAVDRRRRKAGIAADQHLDPGQVSEVTHQGVHHEFRLDAEAGRPFLPDQTAARYILDDQYSHRSTLPLLPVIPVIDLAGGRAVHATGGERRHYPALRSALSGSDLPAEIVAAFLGMHPFTRLYIADLDALSGRPGQTAIIADLARRFPQLELWVDAGIATLDQWLRWQSLRIGTAVLGSETIAPGLLAALADHQEDYILSLDYRQGRLLGTAADTVPPALWPARVIVMSLDHVGRSGGPDVDRLQRLKLDHPRHQLYAAGGVRDADDLRRLQALGMAGALLASAMHSGAIDSRALSTVP